MKPTEFEQSLPDVERVQLRDVAVAAAVGLAAGIGGTLGGLAWLGRSGCWFA